MKIVAIIQARMGSTRLPGKVLAPLAGQPVIAHVVRRAQAIPSAHEVVIATGDQPRDDALEAWCLQFGVRCIRGSEDDVLGRYAQAARVSGADHVIRITGDCPLIEPAISDRVARRHLAAHADYSSNVFKRSFPRGWDTEIFSRELLETAFREARDPFQKEHVTPFMWQQPGRFHIATVEAEGRLRRPDVRICIDTVEDLEVVRLVLDACRENRVEPDAENIITLFERHPEWIRINAHIVQRHA